MLIIFAVVAGMASRTPIAAGPSRATAAVLPAVLHSPAGRPAPTPLPRSNPTQVSIPAINAASSLIPLGLNPNQTVQVPPLRDPMQAGWYSLGPTPGERGASVILGHVDGYGQPGIFYRLRELEPGDRIFITREDRTTVPFVVYRTEQVPKTQFPTIEVYGATTLPELRLVTCGGEFDWRSGNYRDNVIVYAALTPLRRKPDLH